MLSVKRGARVRAFVRVCGEIPLLPMQPSIAPALLWQRGSLLGSVFWPVYVIAARSVK